MSVRIQGSIAIGDLDSGSSLIEFSASAALSKLLVQYCYSMIWGSENITIYLIDRDIVGRVVESSLASLFVVPVDPIPVAYSLFSI